MKIKIGLIVVVLIIYSVLDHFFSISFYFKGAIEIGLLGLGFMLLAKGALSVLKTSENKDDSQHNTGVICLLSGGFILSPDGFLGIALVLLLVGLIFLSQLKNKSQ